MKYLKIISEKTIKNLIEENLSLKVENINKTDDKCLITIKSDGYNLDLKFNINDYEATCLNENFKTELTKKLTNLIRDLFLKFFNKKYENDLKNYLLLKENKFIKKLKNKDIENIFKPFKVLKIKRLNNAIEVTATNNLNKEFLSCYITNFKITNANPKLYKKEIKKIEKNFFVFMVSSFGQKYLDALILNQNKDNNHKNINLSK